MTTHTNEHDYSKLWAVAPSWARYIVTTSYEYVFYSEADPIPTDFGDMGTWEFKGRMQFIENHRGNGDHWRSSKQEIPERERELNRLADIVAGIALLSTDRQWIEIYNDTWSWTFESDSAHHVDKIKSRRKQRIEAGLIELDEKAAEMAEAEPAEWPSEVLCSQFWVAKVDRHGTHWPEDGPHDTYKEAAESIPLLESLNKKDTYAVTETRFRPIETPEQKAERELMDKMDADLEWIERTYRKAVYDWLKSEGKV